MKRAFAILLFVVLLGGCLGAKQTWSAQPVSTAEVRITPQQVHGREDRPVRAR